MSDMRALILDAGGVLVHPLHGDWTIPAGYRELLGDYARDVHSAAWRDACAAETDRLREDIVIDGMEAEYAMRLDFLRAVAPCMGWRLDESTLEALARDFTYNLARFAPYPDTCDWLARWQGRVRLGLLSDAMPSLRALLRESGLEGRFEAVVISSEIGACKPSPKMYGEICARMNVAPEDCLFADDKVCNLTGATDFGMRAVQMCRDGLPEWDGPTVHDLSELNAYWENLR